MGRAMGYAEKDAHGNAVQGDVILRDTANAYVRAEHGLVAVAGLDNVVVVATDAGWSLTAPAPRMSKTWSKR